MEYVRHGTRCLTAGLFVHTGKVPGMVTPNRPKEVFLDFLNLLDAHVPEGQVIHLVLDNLNTHRGTHIETWLAAHPNRVAIYYLPFHASWLNQIEAKWTQTEMTGHHRPAAPGGGAIATLSWIRWRLVEGDADVDLDFRSSDAHLFNE